MNLKNIYILLLFQITTSLYAGIQFKWRLACETGLYEEKNIGRSDLFVRIEGQSLIEYRIKDVTTSIQVKGIPSYYSAGSGLGSFKLFGRAFIDYTKPAYALSLDAIKRSYDFESNFYHIYGDLQLLQTTIKIATNRKLSFGVLAGIGQENIHTTQSYVRDLWYMELDLVHRLLKSFKMSYGLYYEDFLLHRNETFLTEYLKNAGLRFGPGIRMSYFAQFWITLEYRYLKHISELVASSSYESNLRFFMGKALTTRLSLLLLVDYYYRRFNFEQIDIPDINLLYAPMDMENRLYLKTIYRLSDHKELYTRFGYGKENFRQQLFVLEGWRIIFGISFKY
jgi:hypothetical protein